MLRSLIVVCLFVFAALMMDTSSAEAHRWRRCGYYRPAYYGAAYYRPYRVYRPHYYYGYGPRVRLGVGIGYYGW